MIACLENSIDLTLCEARDPSVFYLDDMPGISVKRTDAQANDIQQTFKGVIASVKRNASRKLLSDLRIVQENWTPNILHSATAGFMDAITYPTEIGGSGWRGMAIQSYSSNYSGLYVKTIQFYAQAAGTFVIFVYDLTNGQVVDVIEKDVIEGHNTIVLERAYAVSGTVRRLAFVYDPAAFEPTLTPLYQGCNCALAANCGCGYSCGFYRITGVNTPDAVPLTGNISETNYAYGLIIHFEIKCMYEMFICANIDLFRDAYINLFAHLLMQGSIHSDRLNRFTITDRAKKEELSKEYLEQYMEILKNLREFIFAGDGCCFCPPRRIINTYKFMGGGNDPVWRH